MNRDKNKILGGTQFKGTARTTQAGIERLEYLEKRTGVHGLTLAQVTAVYPDRMTCDLISSNGGPIRNVPLMSKGGLENDEVWGEVEVPSVDSYVIVGFIDNMQGFPVILGMVFPYAFSKFQSNQTVANSGSKTFTQKLLENVDLKTYRRVFKSGTTIEVQDDGTIIVEAPDGTYIQVDASAGTFHIEDSSGNTIVSDASKITINGNLEIDQ